MAILLRISIYRIQRPGFGFLWKKLKIRSIAILCSDGPTRAMVHPTSPATNTVASLWIIWSPCFTSYTKAFARYPRKVVSDSEIFFTTGFSNELRIPAQSFSSADGDGLVRIVLITTDFRDVFVFVIVAARKTPRPIGLSEVSSRCQVLSGNTTLNGAAFSEAALTNSGAEKAKAMKSNNRMVGQLTGSLDEQRLYSDVVTTGIVSSLW